LIGSIIGCAQKRPSKSTIQKRENLISYAQTLEIFEDSNSIKVHIINPENKHVYKLYLARDTKNIPAEYTYIKTPVNSIIALSGTHIGMLSKIDEISKIVGVSDKKYIYNPDLLARIANGKTTNYGGEAAIPFESIVKTKAELLVFSGFGQDFPQSEQLLKLGTVCIPNFDWKENHPLGKAEWIKFFGYLTGKEEQATAYFNKVEKEYNALKQSAKTAKESPTLFSGNLTGDIWFTPAGESFNALLFKDANANYVYGHTKGTGSLELSMEKVLAENIETEFWLNPGYSCTEDVVKINPKMSYFKAVKKKQIYCYSPNMNKFWELSAIEPQHVLSDLIRILHRDIKSMEPLYFYTNISK
jgi:iron complex transport system substrate-binding protein